MRNVKAGSTAASHAKTISAPLPRPTIRQHVKAVAIASSTGGPQALHVVLKGLKPHISGVPLFITQHMPPKFTTVLAKHLNQEAGFPVHEATNAQIVQNGNAYLAAGDYHLTPEKEGMNVVLRLNQLPPENYCRPRCRPNAPRFV